MKIKNLKSKMVKMMSAMLVGVTMLSTTQTVVYANSSGHFSELGTAYLYKMDNVDPVTGCGDYLLEVRLQEGWKPYNDIIVQSYPLCMANHKGYISGDETNEYILENTKGCTLADSENCGVTFYGKLTNPENGIVEVPLNICSEHDKKAVYERNASLGVAVDGASLVIRSFFYKDALPISERGNQPESPVKPEKPFVKASVEFQIGNPIYYVTKSADSVITNSMEKGEEPFMSGGRTMVAVRYAGEALGCQIEWNPAKREVIVKSTDGNAYRLPLDSQFAYDKDGNKYDLGAKTIQKNGRTFVAVGALGRILNCEVEWDSKTQSAIFTQK